MGWTGAGAPRVLGNVLVWIALVGLFTAWLIGPAGQSALGQEPPLPTGPTLYQANCAWCHGARGEGSANGPTLVGVGAASADFYIRSGRMPLVRPDQQARRGPVQYNEPQIQELVGYVGSLGGPEVPIVDLAAPDAARGGQLYRANCAQCHEWDGKGGALVQRENAPPLHGIPPTQVAEAIRIGPGAMPLYGEEIFDEAELNDIVAHVESLNDPVDAGGYGLAHWGPSTEMLVGIGAVGVLLLVCGWLGKRTGGRDLAPGAEPEHVS